MTCPVCGRAFFLKGFYPPPPLLLPLSAHSKISPTVSYKDIFTVIHIAWARRDAWVRNRLIVSPLKKIEHNCLFLHLKLCMVKKTQEKLIEQLVVKTTSFLALIYLQRMFSLRKALHRVRKSHETIKSLHLVTKKHKRFFPLRCETEHSEIGLR